MNAHIKKLLSAALAFLFTGLVADGAGSLAGGLAAGFAFTAAIHLFAGTLFV